jgi:hypothetical protein
MNPYAWRNTFFSYSDLVIRRKLSSTGPVDKNGSSNSDYRVQKIRQIVRRGIAAKRSQILSETNLLIFGPAKGKEGYSYREELRRQVGLFGCHADYAEDILRPKENLLVAEETLANQYNLIFVVLKGTGTVAEISSYLRVANLAPKFRIFQEAIDHESPGLVNEVIQPFCQMYNGYCPTFSNTFELKEAATKAMEAFVLYTLTYGYKPS